MIENELRFYSPSEEYFLHFWFKNYLKAF